MREVSESMTLPSESGSRPGWNGELPAFCSRRFRAEGERTDASPKTRRKRR
ncbi:hypothetical protein WDV94_15180 [Clavibacter tessellarius]